jgi:hypothetical protein
MPPYKNLQEPPLNLRPIKTYEMNTEKIWASFLTVIRETEIFQFHA